MLWAVIPDPADVYLILDASSLNEYITFIHKVR